MDRSGPTLPEDPLTGPRVMAWRSLMQAQVRVLVRIRTALEPLGLSISDFDVLVNLAPGESVRHATLARRVVLSSTGLTRLVDRMCHRGLLQRHDAQDDGRGVVISLTAQGAALRQEAVRLNAEAVHHALRGLDEQEVAMLAGLTGAIGRGDDAHPGEGHRAPEAQEDRPSSTEPNQTR